MVNRNSFVFYILLAVFITACFSLIQGWVSIFARTWIWAGLAIVTLLYTKINVSYSKLVAPLFFYGLVLILNLITGDKYFDDIISIVMELAAYFATSMAALYFLGNVSLKGYRTILYIFIAVLIITCVGTYICYLEDPNLLRHIQSDINTGGSEGIRSFYNRFGVESYDMGHALPALIPFVIYNIKNNSESIIAKVLWTAALVSIAILVYLSTATTALISLFFILAASIVLVMNPSGSKSKYFLWGAVVLVVLPTIASFLLDIWTSSGAGTNSIGKAEQLQRFLESGETMESYTERQERYDLTWDAIISSPIWGVNDGNVGGHQLLADRLATLGLLGVIPLVMFLVRYYKTVRNSISKVLTPYLLISCANILVMILFKAVNGFEFWVIQLFFMPIMGFYASREIEEKNSIKLT